MLSLDIGWCQDLICSPFHCVDNKLVCFWASATRHLDHTSEGMHSDTRDSSRVKLARYLGRSFATGIKSSDLSCTDKSCMSRAPLEMQGHNVCQYLCVLFTSSLNCWSVRPRQCARQKHRRDLDCQESDQLVSETSSSECSFYVHTFTIAISKS